MATDEEILQAGKLMGDSFKGIGESVLGLRKSKRDAAEDERLREVAKAQAELLSQTAYGQGPAGQSDVLGVAAQTQKAEDITKDLRNIDPQKLIAMFGLDSSVKNDPMKMQLFSRFTSILRGYNEGNAMAEARAKEAAKWYAPQFDANGNLKGTGYRQLVTPPAVDLGPIGAALEDDPAAKGKNEDEENPSGGVDTVPRSIFTGKKDDIGSIEVPRNQNLDAYLSSIKNPKPGIMNSWSKGLLGTPPEQLSDDQIKKIRNYITSDREQKVEALVIQTNPELASPENLMLRRSTVSTIVNKWNMTGAEDTFWKHDKEGNRTGPASFVSTVKIPVTVAPTTARVEGGSGPFGKKQPDTSGKIIRQSDVISQKNIGYAEELESLNATPKDPRIQAVIDAIKSNPSDPRGYDAYVKAKKHLEGK